MPTISVDFVLIGRAGAVPTKYGPTRHSINMYMGLAHRPWGMTPCTWGGKGPSAADSMWTNSGHLADWRVTGVDGVDSSELQQRARVLDAIASLIHVCSLVFVLGCCRSACGAQAYFRATLEPSAPFGVVACPCATIGCHPRSCLPWRGSLRPSVRLGRTRVEAAPRWDEASLGRARPRRGRSRPLATWGTAPWNELERRTAAGGTRTSLRRGESLCAGVAGTRRPSRGIHLRYNGQPMSRNDAHTNCRPKLASISPRPVEVSRYRSLPGHSFGADLGPRFWQGLH